VADDLGSACVTARETSCRARGDLAGNHPEGVSRTLGQLRQHLEILIGEQFGVGVVAVHGLKMLRRWHGPARGVF
jgi:hypothetical protein